MIIKWKQKVSGATSKNRGKSIDTPLEQQFSYYFRIFDTKHWTLKKIYGYEPVTGTYLEKNLRKSRSPF